jgi:hypothetical protein
MTNARKQAFRHAEAATIAVLDDVSKHIGVALA